MLSIGSAKPFCLSKAGQQSGSLLFSRKHHGCSVQQAPRSLTCPRLHRRMCKTTAVLEQQKPATNSGSSPNMSKVGTPASSVSEKGLPRTATIGVLGGGQLGRMMALAAANLGVRVKSLDPTPKAPAAVVTEQTVGSFQDAAAIAEFIGDLDVLTVEIEHVDAGAMEKAAETKPSLVVEPSAQTLRTIQDKYAQKVHFAKYKIPLPDFADIPDEGALRSVAADFGYPLMLKSKRFAYDGRGNFVVKSPSDLLVGVEKLGGFDHGIYAERWAPFVKELAVMVVRSRDSSVVSYPVVETIHKNNICHVTEAPADVSAAVMTRATQVAENAISCLWGAGIFGVEMFLLPNGEILLNEVAPRPHNSGHYTMDGCITSQFENHVRAIMGWPLGDTALTAGSALMLNLLGEADDELGVWMAHQYMASAFTVPGAKVHWYDKEGMKLGRKVGHINIVARNREEGRRKLALIDPSAAAALDKTTKASAEASAAEHAARNGATPRKQAQVGIIMGSDSDLPTMKAAAEALAEFGVPAEVTVVSAHRTPERMMQYARTAHERGIKVIIAGAGGAAHLPGMVAAMTPLPVIGVPVKPAGSHLDGMDALLSIVQMPRGVPVATVAIGNATNAGLLAARILASSNPELQQKMLDYQSGMKDTVLNKAEKLEDIGWEAYLKK